MKSIQYLLFCFLILSVISCDKIKKDPISYVAQVSFAPLSANAPNVDFYLNNAFQARTVAYSATVGTANYAIPYFVSEIGNVSVKYTPTGVSTPYVTRSITLEDNKAYSTFLIDSIAKAKLAIVEDDLSNPTSGNAKFRFFHFSGNTIPVDVFFYPPGVTNPSPIYLNRAFNDQETLKDFQLFRETPPGNYIFEVRAAGTTTVLTTFATLSFLPDRIYTLALRGFTGGTGNRAVSGWWYTNKR